MARQKGRKASEALDPILKAGRSISVGDLAEELVSALGGAKNFAAMYAKELQTGTKPGSVSRAKMLDGVMRIVTSSSSQNRGKEVDDTQLDDDELNEVVSGLLGRAGISAEGLAGD
jgi:hypothetical protein